MSVEAAAPIVDVRSAGISDVVENERIVELPLQGRQVTDLIVLAGAAVQTGTASNRAMPGGVSISVAGGLSFGVAYMLDGAMHNDVHNNANLPMPFPDALQEFSVATSGLTAQNGMHSGASVNAVTKSGTNSLHGNAFEFVRDKRFNAKDPFAAIDPATASARTTAWTATSSAARSAGRSCGTGCSSSAATRARRSRQTPAANITYVPTAAMLAGDFTTFASPACQGRDVTLRGGVRQQPHQPDAVQPGGAEHGQAAADDDRSLRPDHLQTCRTTATRETGSAGSTTSRSANHSIFGRYMFKFAKKPIRRTERRENVLTTTAQGMDNLAQGVAIGDTLVFGSTR